MCLGRSTPHVRVKPAPFDSLRHAPFSLVLQLVLAVILQNGAKFIQKLTPGFKNHMRNLDSFGKAVESPKS